ncbi:MAG: FGGY-family carbohydrate kinase [Anaerolineae bacterium]|nr:FGGY-family carbohydrate kinase [Anaerolineae bacterium]
MAKENILVIDYGTQSVRVQIFNPQGDLLDMSQVHIEPYYMPQPSWAEQDPDKFWQWLVEACEKLWASTEISRDSLAGVAITTQRATIFCVDEAGKPLRPAILWLDQRRTEGLKQVGGWWGLLFALAGMRETAAYVQGESEVNWIMTYQPDIWEKTHKVLFFSGFLAHRLTGRFVDSVGSQVGYLPFDYKSKTWAKPSDWKWQAVPMEPDKLVADLVPPAQPMGEISAEASAATGIPAGLPVIAAAADKACEVLGSGGVYPNIGCLSYGTTATINTTHKKYIEVIPLIPPYPSAVPDAYSLEVQVYRGYWMVSWFSREFGLREQQIAERRGLPVEGLFDKLIEDVPPGSLGLLLQPFWSPGLRKPGPEAKGAIIGWGDVHTREHMYRSILEGVAYALREGKESTERRSHVPITELRVAGGGSQSDAAMQITADVFGLPVSRPHTHEAAGLGAAIDAAVGLGFHGDFETAVGAMVRLGRTFEPDAEAHKIYDALYRRVYKKLYKRLSGFYHEIRDITGYPAKYRG